MSSAGQGDLPCCSGGEANEEKHWISFTLSKTQKETLFLLENETSQKIMTI